MSVNKVILLGRLTREPESRAFPDGGSICNVGVATNRTWKGKETGEKKEAVEYHAVVFRNRLGEVAQQYLHKGSQVYVEGRIQTRKWQDKNGQDRYSTEIMGNVMTMLDGKSSADNSGQSAVPPHLAVAPQAAPLYSGLPENGVGNLDDDIPFRCT